MWEAMEMGGWERNRLQSIFALPLPAGRRLGTAGAARGQQLQRGQRWARASLGPAKPVPTSSHTSLQLAALGCSLSLFLPLMSLRFLLHFLSFLLLCDISPLNWCCLPTYRQQNLSVFCCRAPLYETIKIQTQSFQNSCIIHFLLIIPLSTQSLNWI